MEIEKDQNQQPSSSPQKQHFSIKSRKSNQSCFSIGGTHYYPKVSENQKISLESNISSKAKQMFKDDLFENLVNEQSYNYVMREQTGSFKPKRNAQWENRMSQEGQQKMSIEPEPIKKEVTLSCKCPKSKCLLMYCECFSRGVICNESCACYNCRNNPTFEEKRQHARNIVLERDPNAFLNKGKLEVIETQQNAQLAVKKGCNCKRTNCFKKYCECYFSGVKCTYLCNCENCMNGGVKAFKS